MHGDKMVSKRDGVAIVPRPRKALLGRRFTRRTQRVNTGAPGGPRTAAGTHAASRLLGVRCHGRHARGRQAGFSDDFPATRLVALSSGSARNDHAGFLVRRSTLRERDAPPPPTGSSTSRQNTTRRGVLATAPAEELPNLVSPS
ncbi:hypothetical protein HPB47_008139 [Ixodes persulcatus]|uniref:Uncharacterized protein n=1 Tax=Ixodes persulcatus TaxID=34615 RepID=A0AC60P5X0_IXOPE|nr:hypothetical protein HPB47_008139 [Ixodes persulcatus]